MSLMDRMRRRREEDSVVETVADIHRSEAQSFAPADIIAMENEMLPWLAAKRRETEKARLRGEWDDTGGDTT